MFPADFEYLAPRTLDDALAVLAEHGDEAKVLAGGQSLIPLMKLRFAAPSVVVDINKVPGLDGFDADGDGLRIGALVRNATLERSADLHERFPTLAAAAPQISDPVVRNRGTLVGSLCHADPQGDWVSVLLATGGELIARSGSGERRIPITELVDGPFETTLRPDEIAVAATVPAAAPGASGTYLKLERKVGDFATVGVAVFVVSDGGRVSQAGIGLTGVAPTNLKATAAEQALIGRELDEAAIEEAARLAADATDPHSDHRGSADYKRHVVSVFVARGLREATRTPVPA
jgi:carbon-monoxide dehydrogenase medium subunit